MSRGRFRPIVVTVIVMAVLCLPRPSFASGLGFDIREKQPQTTKGDLATHNGTTFVRLPVGSDGQILSADSAEAYGMKWIDAPTGITDHGALNGLADDDHTQYVLLAGRSSGQTLIGGTTTTADITLQTTSGVGTTGADMHFLVGSNGGTEAITILNNGNVGIGTVTPDGKLDVVGTIYLTEQADAAADVAGKGQIWVNTAVPNELWFTDDGGTDAQLGTFTPTLKTKLDGIEALADVTDTTNVTAAGALMDSEVDADIKTLALPASTTITAVAATVLDDATVGAMVDTLGGASSTGTGGLVRATSPTLETPALGTPTSGVMTNVTGIPVSALADGTDGELITWDAAGAPAAVAVGTAGHVLTSNGAGAAPTFQAGGAGASNPTTVAEDGTQSVFCTSSTAEQTVMSYDIPANELGTKGLIYMDFIMKAIQSSGGSSVQTHRITIGTTIVASHNFTDPNGVTSYYRIRAWIVNNNSASAQVSNGWFQYTQQSYGSGDNQIVIPGSATEDTTGIITVKYSVQSNINHASMAVTRMHGMIVRYDNV